MDVAQARARVASFYALEVVRAAEGRLPSLSEFGKRAAGERRCAASIGRRPRIRAKPSTTPNMISPAAKPRSSCAVRQPVVAHAPDTNEPGAFTIAGTRWRRGTTWSTPMALSIPTPLRSKRWRPIDRPDAIFAVVAAAVRRLSVSLHIAGGPSAAPARRTRSPGTNGPAQVGALSARRNFELSGN